MTQRQDGIVTVGSHDYRIINGNTDNPTVYVVIRRRDWFAGQINQRRLDRKGRAALQAVAAFRRLTAV